MMFDKKDYFQESFEEIVESKQIFSEIEFEECKFIDCSFVECKFVKCKFISCEFRECVLSAVVLDQCRFVDTNFVDSKVIGIDWTKAKELLNLSFTKCQLNYSNFKLLKLPKIKMVDCQAKEVEFIETDLRESDLSGTDFEGSIFSKTNLAKANLVKAKNYFINPRNNNIKKAKFSLPEAMSLLDCLDIDLAYN